MKKQARTVGRNKEAPKTIVEAVRLACADARKLDREVYEANWERYHFPRIVDKHGRPEMNVFTNRPDRCMVCLAGAVMAGTLELSPNDDSAHVNVHFEDKWDNAMYAIDAVRNADWAMLVDAKWITDDEYDALYDKYGYTGSPVREFESWAEFDELMKWVEDVADFIETMREATPCAA